MGDKESHFLVKGIFSVVSGTILVVLLFIVWKYYEIDPVDKGILINE